MATQNKSNRLQKMVMGVATLPTLPQVISHINRLMTEPKTTASQIAEAIGRDQAMTMRVLKTVNSAYYGFQARVTQMNHAITILGFGTTRSLVLATSVINSLSLIKNPNLSFNINEYWVHSLAVATASKILARELAFPALAEDAFVAGLLHDIGKMILLHNARDDFELILGRAEQTKTSTLIIESELLGFTHEDAGGMLAARWDLPPLLVAAISQHHNPLGDSGSKDLHRFISIIHMADAFCKMIGLGHTGDDVLAPIDPEAWKLLRLNGKVVDKVLAELVGKRDELYALIGDMYG